MKKIKLQYFAEAVSGKKVIYLYRKLAKQATDEGKQLAFATENSTSISVDSDSTATKDGPIRTAGTPEIEISSTSILAKGEAGDVVREMKAAMLAGEIYEVWEANLEEPGEKPDTFKGTYYQALITDYELSSDAEDHAEAEIKFGVNGIGIDGDISVSQEQQELAAYGFADTKPVTASQSATPETEPDATEETTEPEGGEETAGE